MPPKPTAAASPAVTTPAKSKPLTVKQQRFVEAYDGNGTAAARAAGYRGSDAVLGTVAYENLKKPEIKAAIEARAQPATERRLLKRTARQDFWAEVAENEKETTANRLRASELLGKSEADFTEKVQHSAAANLEQLLAAAVGK